MSRGADDDGSGEKGAGEAAADEGGSDEKDAGEAAADENGPGEKDAGEAAADEGEDGTDRLLEERTPGTPGKFPGRHRLAATGWHGRTAPGPGGGPEGAPAHGRSVVAGVRGCGRVRDP